MSVTVTTSVFCPSRSVIGRLSGTARAAGDSSRRVSSPPFSATVTRAIPCPPETTPASVIASCWTRARSTGELSAIVSGTATGAGGTARVAGAAAPAGGGGVATAAGRS